MSQPEFTAVKRVDHGEGVVSIVLNRPEKRNALSHEMGCVMLDLLKSLATDPEVRVVLLCSSGTDFSSGHDLSEDLAPDLSSLVKKADGESSVVVWERVYIELVYFPIPTIAVVRGLALAGGAGLALCCDVRVAGESARFGWPQVKRGITSVSGPVLLSRVVPKNIALQYLYTGEFMSAERALGLGLMNEVVPDDKAFERGLALAKIIGSMAPLAIRGMKEALNTSIGIAIEDAVRNCQRIVDRVMETEDATEGLRSFLEKRAPVWKGR